MYKNCANFQVVYKVRAEVTFKRPNVLFQSFLKRLFQITLNFNFVAEDERTTFSDSSFILIYTI